MTKAEQLAIDILNKMHAEHGLQEVMKCKFCTSMRAERILSDALAPLIAVVEASKVGHYERAKGNCGCGLCTSLKALEAV